METLSDFISPAAMLEQVAEEGSELAQAALKMSRFIRDENPLSDDKTEKLLLANLEEEVADLLVCFNELQKLGYVDKMSVDRIMTYKESRVRQRFRERKEQRKLAKQIANWGRPSLNQISDEFEMTLKEPITQEMIDLITGEVGEWKDQ